MTQLQKDIIIINDPKKIKLLNKPFTKQILGSFSDKPKTASEIAKTISFPKEKIYYHIKNLLAKDILLVADTQVIKGIEQKSFIPSAKEFQIREGKNQPPKTDPEIKNIFNSDNEEKAKKEIKRKVNRKISERRRVNGRRNQKRRLSSNRRNKNKSKFEGEDKRTQKERRYIKDQRNTISRRELLDRRFENNNLTNRNKVETTKIKRITNKSKSIKYKNFLLGLNGVKDAMTFVHTGNNVTFLFCKLQSKGFEIQRINNYRLPLRVKENTINTLPELIANVFNQFIEEKNRKKIYLAIHSDNYQYEMTYVNAKGKNERLFEYDLNHILNNSYKVDQENCIINYTRHDSQGKNATVCFSTKKPQIEKDYSYLKEAGLQPRYNTSIPNILNNIYKYYNLDSKNDYSLLIYIDRTKTHTVFTMGDQLFESREFNKGLYYFSNTLKEISLSNNGEADAESNAMHFLSYYGIGAETTDTNIQDGFPFKKAQSILEHLALSFTEDIKEAIYFFENVLTHDGFSIQPIDQVYISGPGSHIKNLDKSLNDALRLPVSNLSDYCTEHIKNIERSKSGFLNWNKGETLFKKQKNTASQLSSIKKRIHDHKKAIESAKSPESAKYRLARLEIEKDSKLKSLEAANIKLISASKEFKGLKDEYTDSQEVLRTDLDSIIVQLDDQSQILVDSYNEHESITKRISEIEYESDQTKQKKENEKKDNRYETNIKHAARSRAKFSEDKDRLEDAIDDLESKIIKLEESVQHISIRLDNGQDEISIFEYLNDSIQNTANAFKRSFLEHLRSIEHLSKDDLNTLQKSGYLLTQNTKRIDEINESFKATVSGDLDVITNETIDGNDGVEIREKLLKILDLVLDAPDKLIHLKNLTGSIIKINESQQDLKNKDHLIKTQIRKSKRKIREDKKSLTALKKEINVNQNDLLQKEDSRQEKVEVLRYVRDTIDMIQDLDHHNILLKELRPQKKTNKKDLEELTQKMTIINRAIDTCNTDHEDLEIGHAELNHSFEKEMKNLNDEIELLGQKESELNNAIDEDIEKGKLTDQKIKNALTYIDQLEKQCISSKKEIEELNQKKIPIVESAQKEKIKIKKEFEKRLKQLEVEKSTKLAEAEKTKTITIGTFFKKELTNLRNRSKSLQKDLQKVTKDKAKASDQRDRAKSSLSAMKKKKMPLIAELMKQINGWERDLKQGRRTQERLELLEGKKFEWDRLLAVETENKDERVNSLNKAIERKRTDSYKLFIKDGLNRFRNDGDADQIAERMSEESIALDQEEIKKEEQAYDRFLKRYDAFMIRYRKNHRDILTKLKPYGGRKNIILKKIRSGKEKVSKLESMIKSSVNKLDEKNELLILKENELKKLKKETYTKLSEIDSEIKNSPEKEKRARSDIDKRTEKRLIMISGKQTKLKDEMNDALFAVEDALRNEDLILKINGIEEKMLSFFSEIEKSKEQIKSLEKELEKLEKNQRSSESRLEQAFKKHDKAQQSIGIKEDQFKVKEDVLEKQIGTNRKEFSSLQEHLLSLDQQKDELISQKENIDKDFNRSNTIVKELKKKILVPSLIPKSINSSQKNSMSSKKRSNRKEQLRYLDQIEKDVNISIERSELSIKELNILIDKMRNEESGLESSISLIESDLEYFHTDLSRIETLIRNNKEHLEKISSDHRTSLNGISNIKELYPECKIMLNERIANLFTLVELRSKDKDELNNSLDEMKHELKEKRVEAAMIGQQLSKINDDMKKALENSFYEQEQEPEEQKWKWEIAEHKMKSYMDLAQLKINAKDLFDEIVKIEKRIAQLKTKESSVKDLISDNEKVSHKKLKRMEDTCTSLELRITKEKNELEGIENEVQELKSFAFNYGDRIEVLEKELADFREKEVDYELILNDLDRSIESVQERADNIIRSKGTIKENSIDIDYIANLGLLMDPNSSLNLLPNEHIKEFSYFKPNRILQNGMLALILTFSLSAFLQRSSIKPLEERLPIKQSELSLLSMRQQMKNVVENKNEVANTFGQLIKDDKNISEDMVSLLKYLSKNIPENFQVTKVTVDKQRSEKPLVAERTEFYDLLVKVHGFYNNNMEKSSTLSKKLHESFVNKGQFKKVEISKGKKLKKSMTGYKITILL